MTSWYSRIVRDLAHAPDAIEWFDKELDEASRELDCRNKRIEEVAKRLPGMVEYRYRQLSELSAIVEHLTLLEDKAKGAARKQYLEHYNRALTERQVERYAEVDEEVLLLRELRIQFTMMRDKFDGLMKAYEFLHFQLSNITRLRAGGIEDATL